MNLYELIAWSVAWVSITLLATAYLHFLADTVCLECRKRRLNGDPVETEKKENERQD